MSWVLHSSCCSDVQKPLLVPYSRAWGGLCWYTLILPCQDNTHKDMNYVRITSWKHGVVVKKKLTIHLLMNEFGIPERLRFKTKDVCKNLLYTQWRNQRVSWQRETLGSPIKQAVLIDVQYLYNFHESMSLRTS